MKPLLMQEIYWIIFKSDIFWAYWWIEDILSGIFMNIFIMFIVLIEMQVPSISPQDSLHSIVWNSSTIKMLVANIHFQHLELMNALTNLSFNFLFDEKLLNRDAVFPQASCLPCDIYPIWGPSQFCLFLSIKVSHIHVWSNICHSCLTLCK